MPVIVLKMDFPVEQQEPLISVIIPVYNLEREIGRTLESVCGQSYRNLQIVVVDDGSRDGSLGVIRAWAARDGRIEVVDKPNGGLPLARQTGLGAARGEWIHHLDGGDALASAEVYRTAVEAARTDAAADFLLFGFEYETPDGRTEPSQPWPEEASRPLDLLRHIWMTQQYNCVWQYLYRRELAPRLHFDGRLTIGEDTYYTSQLFYAARRFVRIDRPIVRYRVDPGSMSRARYSDRAVESALLFPELLDGFLRDKPERESLEMELTALRLQSLAMIIRGGRLERMEEWTEEFRAAFRRWPQLRDAGVIRTVRKLLALYGRRPLLYRLQLAFYRWKGKVR